MKVYSKEDQIATENLVPGVSVYGERLLQEKDREYRLWNPYRSKLSAGLINGLKNLDISDDDFYTDETVKNVKVKSIKCPHCGETFEL